MSWRIWISGPDNFKGLTERQKALETWNFAARDDAEAFAETLPPLPRYYEYVVDQGTDSYE